MNWDRIEGNWKQFKGKVKVQWGKLTDDQLDVIAGKRDKLAGKIQESYGISKDVAEKQLSEWQKGVAEAVNPTVEEAYWKAAYVREPYYTAGETYDFYAPAYRTGWEGRARFDGRDFDDVEADLRADYERAIADHGPNWEEGRLAARAAWDRIDQIRTTSR